MSSPLPHPTSTTVPPRVAHGFEQRQDPRCARVGVEPEAEVMNERQIAPVVRIARHRGAPDQSNRSGCSRVIMSQSGWNDVWHAIGVPTCE